MKKALLIFLLTVLFVPVFAHMTYAVQEQGDVQLSVMAASISYLDLDEDDDGGDGSLGGVSAGDDQTLFTIGMRLSTYLTAAWELGGGLNGSYNFDTGDAAVMLEALLNFNFDLDETLVPYVGVAGGGFWSEINDDDNFDPAAGAQAGVKYYVADNVNLFAELNYRHVFIDESDVDSADIIAGFFGVGVLF